MQGVAVEAAANGDEAADAIGIHAGSVVGDTRPFTHRNLSWSGEA
jgi:hypothetical protein